MPDDCNKPAAAAAPASATIADASSTNQLGHPQENSCLAASLPEAAWKPLADIATHAWKARLKMVDGATGEIREEMKRVYRHIDSIFVKFQEMGLEVKDHTGDDFDYGLPLKVVTAQPTAGIARERVIETIKPTIYWHKKIIQVGEVVIATPASDEHEQNNY